MDTIVALILFGFCFFIIGWICKEMISISKYKVRKEKDKADWWKDGDKNPY